jgi:hypothetical protein
VPCIAKSSIHESLITLVIIPVPAFVGVSMLNFTIQKKAIRQELINYSLATLPLAASRNPNAGITSRLFSPDLCE